MRRRVAVVGMAGVMGCLVAASASAKTVTWAGANGAAWDLATANWADGSLFEALDAVVFGAAGAGTVQVAEAGVEPGAVTVSGGVYSFEGGPIAGEGPLTVDGGAVVGMGAKLDR